MDSTVYLEVVRMENSYSVTMKGRTRSLLLLALTALMWSIGGLFIKSVDANPLAIAGARSAIASAVFITVLKRPRFTWSFAQIGAALSLSATGILFVTANKMTTAANAILLQFTAPVYVAVLGVWLLKERVKRLDLAAMVLVMGGMVLFFLDNLSASGILGNVVAAASGLSFALFTVFMRMQKDGSPIESVLLGNMITAAIGLPFLYGSAPDAAGWLSLIVLGIVQVGIPYMLYAKAIKQATALEAILIPIIEPILNPVWVFILLGEIPGILSLAGGMIVLAAITARCALIILKEGKT